MKHKEYKIRDKITVSENRYDSGFVEISVYVPALVEGAGRICVGVISRQPGKGSKWCAYGHRDGGARPRVRTHIKSRAVDSIISCGDAYLLEHASLYAKQADKSVATEGANICN